MSRKAGLMIILLMIACTGVFHAWKQYCVQPSELIRLHVVANSNTFFDQDLKYRVKERIVQETSAAFRSAANVEEARALSDAEATRIENIAREEIRQQGYNYPVRVERGTYYFPLKTYTLKNDGDLSHLTLSPGRYEAVRVVIGNGRGANWWCVLYPPLCFADAKFALPPIAMPFASAVEKTVASDCDESLSQPRGENLEQAQAESLGQPRIAYRYRTAELWEKLFRKICTTHR